MGGLANYLKTLREENKLTLEEVALLSGYSNPYISQIENGRKRTPSPFVLRALAKVYGIPYVDLLLQADFLSENELAEFCNRGTEVLGNGMSFGQMIKNARKNADLTLEELQERTGLSKGFLSKLENGKRATPKIDTIKKLATGLNLNHIELLQEAGYFEDFGKE